MTQLDLLREELMTASENELILIDDEEYDIKFLITGSASPQLLRQNSETLAGRIAFFYLLPITLNEVKDTISPDSFVLRGGFPLSLLSENDQDSFRWREGFIMTFLERDLRQFGFNIPPETLWVKRDKY